jgi:hypothetical protein
MKKSLIFYVELIRLNRMSRQKKKEFLLSQPSGLGEDSLETLEKLRDAQTGKTHSPESLDKMREQWAIRKLDINPSVEDNNDLLSTRKKINGTLVVATNIETNLSTEYLSISEAAKALNVTRTTLRTYIKNNKEVILLKRLGDETVKEKYLVTVKGG